MSEKQVFIFGAGYSGKAFARANKQVVPVFGTTRTPEKVESLRQTGIMPLLFDGALTPEISDALEKTTHMVVSVAPEEAGDPVLNAARQAIAAMPALEWIGYLSTVGVYGNYDGAWVDETAECRPVSKRSAMRVAAEQDWLELGRATGKPVAILRLSGIYGPGRNALVNLENGTARRLIKPEQVFVNLDKYGNTSAASVAIALDEAVQQGRIQRGDLVLLVVFGAGLTWAAAVIEW